MLVFLTLVSLIFYNARTQFAHANFSFLVGEGDWEKHRSAFLKRFDEDEYKAEV